MSINDVSGVIRAERDRYKISRAWIFGSRATGTNQAQSDWDILVEFSRPPGFDAFMGLRTLLEQKLGTRVDLLSRSACKPRFLKAIEQDLIDVT